MWLKTKQTLFLCKSHSRYHNMWLIRWRQQPNEIVIIHNSNNHIFFYYFIIGVLQYIAWSQRSYHYWLELLPSLTQTEIWTFWQIMKIGKLTCGYKSSMIQNLHNWNIRWLSPLQDNRNSRKLLLNPHPWKENFSRLWCHFHGWYLDKLMKFWEISWRQQRKIEVGFKNLKNCYKKKYLG